MIKVNCSRCGAEIECMTPGVIASLPKLRVTYPDLAADVEKELASEEWEDNWRGTICLRCMHTFCAKCIIFGPGKCPDCGSELCAINESSLQGSPYPKSVRKRMNKF
jgi:hypothetical protein